jgi:uncharacterized protein involved in exopolysaccharide biosynthesis
MISDSPDHGLIPHSGEGASDQGIDLLALVAAFCEEWRLALTTFLVVMVICIAIIFSLRKQYVAVCSIVPQAGQSNNDLSSLFSNRSPSTLYVGLLQSRTVADDIIDQAHLLDYFHTRSREIARDELADKTTVTSGSDSIVIIKVKDPSASQAALISNAYLTGLEHLNGVMSEDSSRQTREFFQAQLQQERDDLNKAETQLEQTQQKTGIIQPETQTQIGLSAIASTRAQITNLEVQLAAVLQSETEDNPQVKLLRSQIAQLRASEGALENGRSSSPVGAAPPAGQMPQNDLDFVRAQRDVQYHNAVVSALSNQYEAARLTEDVSRPNFQIVDRAVVPENKSWPPRKLMVLASFFLAIILGLSAVGGRLVYLRLIYNPANQTGLLAIRRAFGQE